jgi:hypothetical protein
MASSLRCCLYRPQNSVEQLKGFLLADVRAGLQRKHRQVCGTVTTIAAGREPTTPNTDQIAIGQEQTTRNTDQTGGKVTVESQGDAASWQPHVPNMSRSRPTKCCRREAVSTENPGKGEIKMSAITGSAYSRYAGLLLPIEPPEDFFRPIDLKPEIEPPEDFFARSFFARST